MLHSRQQNCTYHKVYPSHTREYQRGFVSVLILFAAAVLTVFSVGLLDLGKTAIEVNIEKQVLDTHAVMVGKSLITRGLQRTCANGVFADELADDSSNLFDNLQNADAEDRELNCESITNELIVREVGDPDGPPGTFRQYRIRSNLKASVFGNPDDESSHAREVIVEIRENDGKIGDRRAQVMFLLDYSGSMQGNLLVQLKNTVKFFVNQQYDLDYGIIIYDDTIRKTINISSGAQHDATVLSTVNNEEADRSTNFGDPLISAIDLLKQRVDYQDLFIVLISDGNPNAGPDPVGVVNQQVRSINPDACLIGNLNDQCITVYTMGVENANMNLLLSLSGNAATAVQDRSSYSFFATADGTQDTFTTIIEDILCRYGPIDPVPSIKDEQSINVFINDEALVIGDDFEYSRESNSLRFFNEACQEVIDSGGDIVIRYGQPRLIIEE